jgi:hypothetical protein
MEPKFCAPPAKTAARTSYLLSSILLVFFVGGNVRAKDVGCHAGSEPTLQAARFLSALRADLRGKGSVLQFSGEIPLGTDAPLIGFTVDIYDGPLHTAESPLKVASSNFQFNKDCILERYSVNDPTVPPESSYDAITRVVNSHPEWSDSQIVTFLKDRGAKYGPGDREAFMKSLNLAAFETLLGKLEVNDVGFQTAAEDHVGDFAELQWVVDALATKQGYATNHYKLLFDPFGRMVSILRIPGRIEGTGKK